MSLVSVIIPTYNRSALLKQAIESVLAVRHDDIELEVLIIDDGSDDDTAEMVKNYPVVYLRQSGGLGPSGTRNVGLEAARGEFITFLDDDDVWLPTNLAPQVRILREHPDYGMAFARVYVYDNTLTKQIGEPMPSETQHPQWSLTDMLRSFPQIGTVVIRRSVAETVKFDPSLRLGEDWDWNLKIAEQYPVGYDDTIVMLYRTRESHKLHWGIVAQATKVFNRHLHSFSFAERLRLKRQLWKRRGGYAWLFIEQAGEYAGERNYRQSAKSLWNAVRTSPLHAVVLLARTARAKISRPYTAPTTPVAPQQEEIPATITKR